MFYEKSYNFMLDNLVLIVICFSQVLLEALCPFCSLSWYNQQVKWSHGKRFEDKFVETLQKYGYKGSYLSKDWLRQPVFIQSFAPTSLVYISNKTDLPKIFLIDDVIVPTQDTNQVCNTFYPWCLSHFRIIELFGTKCFSFLMEFFILVKLIIYILMVHLLIFRP